MSGFRVLTRGNTAEVILQLFDLQDDVTIDLVMSIDEAEALIEGMQAATAKMRARLGDTIGHTEGRA